jgi:hypothetical protein
VYGRSVSPEIVYKHQVVYRGIYACIQNHAAITRGGKSVPNVAQAASDGGGPAGVTTTALWVVHPFVRKNNGTFVSLEPPPCEFGSEAWDMNPRAKSLGGAGGQTATTADFC